MTRRRLTLEEGREDVRRQWREADPADRPALEALGQAITVWIETPPAKSRRYRPPRQRRR